MKVILATGGTGGHILPAIALAQLLKAQGFKCILYADKKIQSELDSYVLPLRRQSGNIVHKINFSISLLYSCAIALYKLKNTRPNLVIGFGSYASFPTLLAAKILSIPIMLHEQNSILGRVNRFFAESAKLIATSFPITQHAKKEKSVFIGNFTNIRAHNYPLIEEKISIIVIAGSQGAYFFDEIVTAVICALPGTLKKKIKVIQQCTIKNISTVKDFYKNQKIECDLSNFFYDIEQKLANAHLVISRAGATSIAEITIAERPAIYIPYPYAKDNHQFFNAKYIADLGAAQVMLQNNTTKEKLSGLLRDLLDDTEKIYNMARNIKKAQIRSGTYDFAALIKQYLSRTM